MPSLGATFGRGAATMPQWDLAKSDVILVMGSNIAENHPIAFRFALQAKDQGATLIHADPRFTRTSAMADLYAPVRAGSDIAFLGGIIRYLLENDCWFKEFALAYTNLSTIIDERFKDASEGDGFFSGWDEKGRKYTYDSWQYQGMEVPSTLAEHYVNSTESFSEKTKRLTEGPPPRDETLQNPMCVYQILKRHYAAYTPEKVEEITGCPKDVFIKVAEAMAKNSGRERTGAIVYAVGWTHHTTGVQIIRAAAIIQGLLGNVGRPGAGILALRGHCSIQGSTDIPTLYNLLPGYLPQPHAYKPHGTLKEYMQSEATPTGWWHNFPKYAVSLFRAWYGDAATRDNEWGYQWVPKIVGDHSQLPMTLAVREGLIRGMIVLGQNPAVGGSNSGQAVQRAFANLDWLVVRDFTECETASFWYAGHAVKSGEIRPEDIKTEVFLLPSSIAAGEKEGSFTNTHRLLQWHDKIVDAPGDNRSDLWFVYHLGVRLKAMYADSSGERDAPIRNLTWDYGVKGQHAEPSAEDVLKEVNGYTWPDRQQLDTYQKLKDDGSTACGAWIYTGAFPTNDHNQTRARQP
ncbi:MAG: molybdopterin-dependent oxidoreductase, partial [Burkholderiaceae bacterium]